MLRLALLVLALSPSAWAAKTDRERPLIIQGGDGARLIRQAKGHVEMQGPVLVTKGTLLLRAQRLLATEQGDGSQRVVAHSLPGSPVQFSQALETPGETMEAQADQVDYDESTGIARFIGNARWRLLAGGQMQKEFSGNQIVFDTLKEEMVADAKPGSEGGLRIIVMPPKPASGAAPATPLPLQTAPALTPKPPTR